MQNKKSVKLKWGKAEIAFDYDPAQFEILKPSANSDLELPDHELERQIEKAFEAKLQEKNLLPEEKPIIVIPDATRAVGVDRLAPPVVENLEKCGVESRNIKFLIGGGIHRRPTENEVNWLLGEEIPKNYEVLFHDANDEKNLTYLGTTKRGTEVELNSNLVRADRVIQIGGIGFHYIAGFSGGRKVILPGCAGEKTIQQNHKLAFDEQTLQKAAGIASGNLADNPIHLNTLEAVGMLNPWLGINTVTDHKNRIKKVYAGHWEESHRRGCEEYLSENVRYFGEKRNIAIVSVGGFPRDSNLTQSHKALEHAVETLHEGGALILLAECADGLGRADFLEWFEPAGAAGTARKLLKDYKVYGQTVWGIRWKAEKFKVYLISRLADEIVELMGMTPCKSIEEALQKNGRKETGYIIPYGLTTLPRRLQARKQELF